MYLEKKELWNYCRVSAGVCNRVNGDCNICCSVEKGIAMEKIEKERKNKKKEGSEKC